MGGNIRGGRKDGSSSAKGGGTAATVVKAGDYGGSARVRVRYNADLTALSFWDGDNSRILLAEKVLPNLQGHVMCKNWLFYGL